MANFPDYDETVAKYKEKGTVFVNVSDFNGNFQAAEAWLNAIAMTAKKKGETKQTKKRVTLTALDHQ